MHNHHPSNSSFYRSFTGSAYLSERWGHWLQEPLGAYFLTAHWASGNENEKYRWGFEKNLHGLMTMHNKSFLVQPLVSGTAVAPFTRAHIDAYNQRRHAGWVGL
jgi:hypothetical protein